MKKRYYLGYLIIRVLGLLPFRLLYFCGYVLGSVYWWLAARDRHIALVNMRLFYPQLNQKQQLKRARQSLRHMAINIFESLWIWAHSWQSLEKKVIAVDNLELLEAAIKSPRGIVVITPHFGCWEMMSHFVGHQCKTKAKQCAFLARHFNIPILDDYISRARTSSGGEILPATRQGLEQLYRQTAQGCCTGMLPDQEVNQKYAVFVPWMGQVAATAKLVPDLLQKTNAQAIFVVCKRLPKGRGYHIRFYAAQDEIYSQDMATAALSMNDSLATMINWASEQYMWNYRRITKNPDGSETNYYKR